MSNWHGAYCSLILRKKNIKLTPINLENNVNNSTKINPDGPNSLKGHIRAICTNPIFEFGIVGVILINSLLIGVETYITRDWITLTQQIILYIFTAEIILRFFAAESLKSFFKGGWNNFDLFLVLTGYIPDEVMPNAGSLMALRVLRVLRVLRLLRASKEVKLIVTVLIKSTTAMFYNLILFLIFIYLFAIVGMSLFKLPNPDEIQGEELAKYEKLMEVAPPSPSNSPDPFGTLGEAMFTLFRELTGEDWTDLRYNHITAYELGVIKTPPSVITAYHITWFAIAAFLLLNLVTGAVINNYQLAMDESHKREDKECNDGAESSGE